MPNQTLTPTRTVLNQLEAKLRTSLRGHRRLKEKQDELICQFMIAVRECEQLRERVETGLATAYSNLIVASALMSPELLEQALLYPRQHIELEVTYRNVVNITVPNYHFETETLKVSEIFPYGFVQTSGELDCALTVLTDVFSDMLVLAQSEKAVQMLVQEIESTRRRVNALEYVIIPELKENIRYITMKLEESDLSTEIRLMKVREMVLQNIHILPEWKP